MNEIERVARADLEYLVRLADWAAEQGFCKLPGGLEDPDEWCFRMWERIGPENCDGYSADALVDRFTAAIAAMRGEPVGWMYSFPGHPLDRFPIRHAKDRAETLMDGWTETALYAGPTPPEGKD